MELPKRKNIRLKDYDYSQNGAYFVTICAKDMRNLFGKVVVGEIHESPVMQCNGYGAIISEHIEKLPTRYPGTSVDVFCVMPNHLHMIISLHDQRAIRESPLQRSVISQMIGYLKSNTTKKIRELTPNIELWQRGYHDYIIRNQKDYLRIRQYLQTNPAKLESDRYFHKD